MSLTINSPSFSMVPNSMGEAFELAKMMASCGLLPDAFKDKPGNALMIIEQAMRWKMSPFAVAQEVSVIQGKLMMSGKIVSAAVQSSGILADRISYAFAGEGDARTVTVSATIAGEDKPRSISLSLKEARTGNQMWTKQTDQQLVYAGTRVWARRHAPEVMLGVYSPEEMEQPRPHYSGGPTIDAEPQRAEPTKAPVADIPSLDTAEGLRNRADRLIAVLASIGDGDTAKYERSEKNSRNLLADIAGLDDEAAREDLHKMVVDALAFARGRCVVEVAPTYEEADAT